MTSLYFYALPSPEKEKTAKESQPEVERASIAKTSSDTHIGDTGTSVKSTYIALPVIGVTGN